MADKDHSTTFTEALDLAMQEAAEGYKSAKSAKPDGLPQRGYQCPWRLTVADFLEIQVARMEAEIARGHFAAVRLLRGKSWGRDRLAYWSDRAGCVWCLKSHARATTVILRWAARRGLPMMLFAMLATGVVTAANAEGETPAQHTTAAISSAAEAWVLKWADDVTVYDRTGPTCSAGVERDVFHPEHRAVRSHDLIYGIMNCSSWDDWPAKYWVSRPTCGVSVYDTFCTEQSCEAALQHTYGGGLNTRVNAYTHIVFCAVRDTDGVWKPVKSE